MVHSILQGLGLGLLLSISVGPVIFAIIKLSLRFGHKAGYAFVAGVSFSDLVLVLLGNMAAELVRYALKYEEVIAVGGAILLITMGVVSFFLRKDAAPEDFNDATITFRKRDLAKFSLQGFFINILNPAPILFWLTTCTAFAFLPFTERMVLFGSCLIVILLADMLKVALAGKLRNWLTPAVLHKINRVSALVFIGFGVAILIGLLVDNWDTINN